MAFVGGFTTGVSNNTHQPTTWGEMLEQRNSGLAPKEYQQEWLWGADSGGEPSIPEFHKGGPVKMPKSSWPSYFVPTLIRPEDIDDLVKKYKRDEKPFRPGIYYIEKQLKKLKGRKKDKQE